MAPAEQATAASYTWSGLAGDLWDYTDTYWQDGAGWNGSGANSPWTATNGATNTAVFNTAEATLAMKAAQAQKKVHVNSLVFNQTATLGGPGTLTLVGTAPSVTLNADAKIDCTIAGTSGLTVNGANGSLTLSGTNTYSGATTVAAGFLRVSNHIAAAPGTTTTYSVTSGAALSGAAASSAIHIGSGTANTLTVAAGGFITPGATELADDIGTLSITAGKATLAGVYLVDLNYTGGSGNRPSGAGGEADLISITGDLDADGLVFRLWGTNTPAAAGTNYAIKLLEFTGNGSHLDNYTVDGLDTTSGQSVVRWGKAYYLVPEPGALALLGLGSFLLLRRPQRPRHTTIEAP